MKTLFRLVALCAGIAMALSAGAQNYPAKPILMVVPLQAASAVDVMMRVAAQKMSENLGQQIVIENQAGAAGLIGAERVTRAAPDGYTIAGISDSVLTMVPHMHRKIGFDPVTGFEPVGMVAAITGIAARKSDSVKLPTTNRPFTKTFLTMLPRWSWCAA